MSNKFTNFDRKTELKDNSDLTKLYQCTNGTKTINQTVKRHINRLTERFMSRSLPYAFLNKVLQESFLNSTKNTTTLRPQVVTLDFTFKTLSKDIKN